MHIITRLFLVLTAALWAGMALAEDIPLEPVTIRSSEECQAVLAEFNWVCRDFDRAEWRRVTGGETFWDKVGYLLTYRHDLDLDDEDDIIISVEGSGMHRCPRGAPYLCEHIILFGGDEIPEKTRHLSAIVWGHPVLSSRDGQQGLYFDRSPQNFLTIEQVRQEMADGDFFMP